MMDADDDFDDEDGDTLLIYAHTHILRFTRHQSDDDDGEDDN